MAGNTKGLLNSRTKDLITQDDKDVSLHSALLTYIRFSCTSASGQNGKKICNAIDDLVGATGKTFKCTMGLLQFVQRFGVLENVDGLLANGQANQVLRRLAQQGFLCNLHNSNPHHDGFVQNRHRIYFVLVALRYVRELGIQQHIVDNLMGEIHDMSEALFTSMFERMDMDELLFPEPHYAAREPADELMEQYRTGKITGVYGMSGVATRGSVFTSLKSKAEKKHCHSFFSSDSIARCPTWLALPGRAKYLLGSVGMGLPEVDTQRRAVRVDQSKPIVGWTACHVWSPRASIGLGGSDVSLPVLNFLRRRAYGIQTLFFAACHQSFLPLHAAIHLIHYVF